MCALSLILDKFGLFHSSLETSIHTYEVFDIED